MFAKSTIFALFACYIIPSVYTAVSLTPADGIMKRESGEQLIVACNVNQPATPKWYSPTGSEISEDSNQRIHIERKHSKVILRLKGVRSEDRGLWSCDAGLKGKKSFTLDVEDPLVLISNAIEYAPLGETHFIKCIPSAPNKVELSWRKGPYKHKVESSKYRPDANGLHIVTVGMADNDTFWCTADIVDRGKTIDQPIRIIVSEAVTKPNIGCVGDPCAVQGGKAILQCHSSGIPSPKYQWSKGPALRIQSNPDFKYHTDSNSLVINKLNLSDDGTYECRAFNEFDTQGKSAFYTMHVLVPPLINPILPLLISIDESADLECSVDRSSSMPISFQWMHDNGSLLVENRHFQIVDDLINFRSVLRIFNANKAHFLNYTCEARNIAGRRRAVGELRINFPSEFTTNTTTVYFGLEGLESHLRCTFDGYPMPTITWHLDRPSSAELRPGDRNARDITLSQSGPYRWTSSIKIVPPSLSSDLVLFCVARNPRQSSVQITLKRATSPDPPSYGDRLNSFVNTASFKAVMPHFTGGLPVRQIEVRYKPVPDDRQTLEPPFLSERFNVSSSDNNVLVTLGNLLPSTLYRVGLVSFTDFGPSRMLENLFLTSGKTHPIFDVGVALSTNESASLTIANNSNDVLACGMFSSCILKWKMLSDGGSPLTSISISHSRIRTGNFDSVSRQNVVNLPITDQYYELKGLLPLSRYLVEFKSKNEIAQGSKKFFIKTGASPPGYRELQEARKRPGVWAVIGIILLIVTLLVFLCMFVVCLRMPKPNSSGNNFIGKIAGVTSPDPPFFNGDFRDNSMQPLNADTSRNFNPLYKDNSGFESPWNTFIGDSRFEKQRSFPAGFTTDSSRV
ncbi:hypothetical protein GJ496_003266 [Pomphorhynchus laevis]|nr:hypothetical protein GJ496_003266 [Pomphorhynchus laevis]